jgi:hypothetical protein
MFSVDDAHRITTKKVFSILLMTLLLGCARSEVTGTFEVELLLAGIGQPLEGTLILSTRPLDIPSLSEDNSEIDPEWFGGDALGANSCFILSPRRGIEGDPGVVRVFEARIRPDHVQMPLEILRASDLRIDIVKLQFFANAIGGELEIHVEDGIRPGQIRGTRVDSATPLRCVKTLADFREMLRQPAFEGEERT